MRIKTEKANMYIYIYISIYIYIGLDVKNVDFEHKR